MGRTMDFIVNYEQLQRLCRPSGPRPTVTTVRRWADRLGIRYAPDGHGGIWTTVTALNRILCFPDNNDPIFQSVSKEMI